MSYSGLIILVWIAGYFFLQKFRPEQAGKFTEFFSGAEHFLGLGLYYKTLILSDPATFWAAFPA